MITVPAWCVEVADAFRAIEHTAVVPAQLVNDRDAAIVHFALRALANGGPEVDVLIETIDRERATA